LNPYSVIIDRCTSGREYGLETFLWGMMMEWNVSSGGMVGDESETDFVSLIVSKLGLCVRTFQLKARKMTAQGNNID